MSGAFKMYESMRDERNAMANVANEEGARAHLAEAKANALQDSLDVARSALREAKAKIGKLEEGLATSGEFAERLFHQRNQARRELADVREKLPRLEKVERAARDAIDSMVLDLEVDTWGIEFGSYTELRTALEATS